MEGGSASLSIMSGRKSLVNELKDPAYRHAFTEAHAADTIAFQLKRMREARGWTQGQLAVEAFGDAKLQSMVSRLENPDYGKYSVSTLVNLAKVFDVGLVVRFAPFSEVVDWDLNKTAPTLEPAPFAQDVALEERVEVSIVPSIQKAAIPKVVVFIPTVPSFYRDEVFVGGSKPLKAIQVANPNPLKRERETSWRKEENLNSWFLRRSGRQSKLRKKISTPSQVQNFGPFTQTTLR
jgi:transcriptional regulator with XRE-family HTH domain